MIAKQELESKAHEASLVHVFRERARATPAGVAARFKQDGAWRDVTWEQFARRVDLVAQGLLAGGLQKGDRVCLMGDTRFEWVVMDLAVQTAGGVTVPIYQSNTPEECRYIVDNCGAKLVFADTASQAAKYVKVRAELPLLGGVVQYLGPVADAAGGFVRAVADLEAEGARFAAAQPGALDARASELRLDDLSTLIYTSGTTGNPKGVMLVHDAFVYEADAIDRIGIIRPTDVELLFMPLAHVFAQVLKAIWFKLGHVMAFAESIDKLMDNMGETQPSFMAAVPRIFEKVFNKVLTDGAGQPGLKGMLFRMTVAEFEKYAHAKDEGREYNSLALAVGRKLVLPKVKAKLDARFGGKMRFFISGGAPLSRKIGHFFDLAGITILEGYGLTETCAATCVNRPQKNKIGTVGPAVPGMQLRIAADGEILIRGRGVMKGYWNNPVATAEVLAEDGWFATGDIGELDADGYLRITDRKKDIIVTAGGKNVAPQNLENALKASAIISQVVVHGDQRKYLTALVTVAEEAAQKLVATPAASYAELTQRPEVRAAVQAAIDGLNAHLPSYSTIKKFEVLPADFTQATGELTPSLKVKRKFCNQKYKTILDAMYDAA
jgi:long-chain acyl-CoA synthetase